MDKKIRAAAENDTHGFDDRAWQDMEVLLEKHLPQKKTRRRVVFFLFIGLLLAGIPTFLILQKKMQGSSTASSANNPVIEQKAGTPANQQTGSTATQQKQNSSLPTNTNTSNTDQPATKINTSTEVATTTTTDKSNAPAPVPSPVATTRNDKSHEKTLTGDQPSTVTNQKVSQKIIPSVSSKGNNASMNVQVTNSGIARKKVVTNTNQPVPDKDQARSQAPNKPVQDKIASDDPATKATQGTTPTDVVIAPVTKPTAPEKTTADIVSAPSANAQEQTATDKKDVVKTEPTEPEATAKTESPVKKEKKKGSFASKFSINFSAGPDVSSVGSKTGKWRSQVGVGIGYTINDRWSVRTGFYAARKIYSADSNSYHVHVPPTYLFRLAEVKANCLVYEVPVSIVYNFARGKKHNWFASASLSSYFMKSEKYDYIYKYMNMQDMHQYTFRNENKHLFSVAGFSAGYQYLFNKRLSLMAEPYLRLPLSGVGNGKVKLRSTGVLFTLGYKPFAKR